MWTLLSPRSSRTRTTAAVLDLSLIKNLNFWVASDFTLMFREVSAEPPGQWGHAQSGQTQSGQAQSSLVQSGQAQSASGSVRSDSVRIRLSQVRLSQDQAQSG